MINNNNNEINNFLKNIIHDKVFRAPQKKIDLPLFGGFSPPNLQSPGFDINKLPPRRKGIWCSRLNSWKKQAHREAYLEKGKFPNINNKKVDYAILPKSFYSRVESYDQTKKYNFCFVGSFYSHGRIIEKRKWIFYFINNFFDKNSYLRFTDSQSVKHHSRLGEFDYTSKTLGYCPRESSFLKKGDFDEDYYRIMCASKFCLCPAGDNHWSMRFYEALMCKTIPIIYNQNEKCRTESECSLDYKYYLVNEQIKEYNYNKDWAEHNYNLFLKYHTYEYIDQIN